MSDKKFSEMTDDEIRTLSGATTDKLTGADRDLIARAREVGPALRASSGDRDRLAGWLLAGLADLAERLAEPCA